MGSLLGISFLAQSATQQDACSLESRRSVFLLGRPMKATVENLGRLLEVLDGFASCYWGCHGQNHTIEYLVGRAVSSARASIRLLEMGHYDESLSLTRNLMEQGNLVWLFYMESQTLREWVNASDRERRNHFSAFAVRERLEALASVVPHNKDDYALLCELAVHPSPSTLPQAHNTHSIPTLGGVYQELGFAQGLVKLSWALASVGGPAARLAQIDREHADEIVEAAIRLVRSLSDVATDRETFSSSEAILEKTRWLDATLRRRALKES
jgi:hypothetical protein